MRFFNVSAPALIIASLLSGCGAQPEPTETASMAEQKISALTEQVATATPPASASPSPAPTLPPVDPSGEDYSANFDCSRYKIHVGDIYPQDRGEPQGEYLAISDKGDVYKGDVVLSGSNYVFVSGPLFLTKAYIERDETELVTFVSNDNPDNVPLRCHPL